MNSPPLRYSARPVRPSMSRHLDAGRLQRLDAASRRATAKACAAAPARSSRRPSVMRRVAPAVAQRHAAELQARRPDGPQVAQQLGEDDRRGDRAAPGAAQPGGRTARRDAAHRRARRSPGFAATAAPSRRSSVGAPLDARQRIGCRSTWKCRRRVSLVRPASAAASARNGEPGCAEKRAVGEHGKARQRQALGAADLRAGRGIAIGPVRSRRRHRAAR